MSNEKILEGLKKLDPTNDQHWTMDGQAKLETVKFFSGGVTVTRDELNVLAPGYSREAMKAYVATLNKTEAGNATVQEPGPIGPGAGADTSESEPAKLVEGPTGGKAEIETLAEEVASADEAVLELKRIHDQTGKDLAEAIVAADALRDRLHVVNPPFTLQQNIKSYHASQQKLREERSFAREQLANSGIDIDGLQERAAVAPIDRSLKGRGRR